MSALAHNNENQQSYINEVTSISSVARVDYILRFSKHAVVVIDEDTMRYSSLGSQYLANLSNDFNAAYLTMSPRLDDLQVRCRIIEQLFGNVLFDPEQSVAVSLINLIKQHKQPVSIVVEHAHHLSFQLLHELTQLAEIAKKANLAIQVVMLAMTSVGQKLTEHAMLFDKKLSIVDAYSGQLIPLNDKRFNAGNQWQTLSQFKKYLVGFLGLTAIGALIVYQLYQVDTFNFSKLKPVSESVEMPVVKQTSEQANLEEKAGNIPLEAESTGSESVASAAVNIAIANAEEISNRLLGKETLSQSTEKKVVEKASVLDIATALTAKQPIVEQPVKQAPLDEKTKAVEAIENNDALKVQSSTTLEPAPLSYYANKSGFVLQFAVIEQEKSKQAFIDSVAAIEVYQYQRNVTQGTVTVLTSKIFESRVSAADWLATAPEIIKSRQPFIRSVKSINAEIDDYQRSQS
ncbi:MULTISPECIES: hypothetical protein [Thalassotalea]|uniref:hypothetical protein n=1 Tax=Thalassotalea TaxID=1518149 RepID=UPI0009444032|nr:MULTISPECIES: hypothetical protein [Thalassotalea]OKY26803.1 hypothetical protein BI291_02065 [Thalassotalea sp. PP2-459]